MDDNIVDFWKICDLLSNQMIKYNLTHSKYAGDAIMIPDTHQNQYSRYNIKYYVRFKIGGPLS